jgi:hypothetical protein
LQVAGRRSAHLAWPHTIHGVAREVEQWDGGVAFAHLRGDGHHAWHGELVKLFLFDELAHRLEHL